MSRQSGNKDAAHSPGIEISAVRGKSVDVPVRRQGGIESSPACADVGGEIHAAAIRSRKEIRATRGDAPNVNSIRPIGLNPLGRCKGTNQNDGECETDGSGSHLVHLSTPTL